MTNTQHQGFATRAIREGYDPLDHDGALNPPVYPEDIPADLIQALATL
jgi:hypothetical protein